MPPDLGEVSPLALALLIASDAAALSLAILARVRWVIRAGAVVLVLGVAFAIWRASVDDAGWPYRSAFPDRSVLLACAVQEPSAGDAGVIYLWLQPPDRAGNPLANAHSVTEPRAYAEPYSLGLESACQAAQKIAAAGGRAGLRSKAKSRPVAGARGPTAPKTRFRAYRLPTPHPPPKG